MKFHLLILLIIGSSFARANDLTIYVDSPKTELKDTNDWIFVNPDIHPQFPGGEEKLYEYLAEYIKYPTCSNHIKGRFYIQFTIDTNGNTKDITCFRCTNSEMEKQAIKAVENMPKWKPATRFGKAIEMKYTLPITICLK